VSGAHVERRVDVRRGRGSEAGMPAPSGDRGVDLPSHTPAVATVAHLPPQPSLK